ncbi:A disintegrin and metalloproteinase with thrombospondin motifs 7 isoform X2 [Achroia grisella]|uniref:A disintegrin and metalloproteinase with thrombospondin motifs 7 isoform X2 n=1 Tax=Achroia grisella TaxID=688607 RepID=UPI0027D31484|nr:A disintegrin and metalloproteinase with thrombospondin motifs 7 isoform X2 [Achroia grisella]
MDFWCFTFSLLLFQSSASWCSAKHLALDNMLRVEYPDRNLEKEVQDSIEHLIHTGIYSHQHLDTSQVQVVTPVKVTHDGKLVSHALEHAHEHGHARARRDLFHTEHRLQHSLHYNLTVAGRDLRLDLRPSVTFITPAMIVERHYAERRTRETPKLETTSCHYIGTIRGQPDSSVAISACDGIAGHLRTEYGEYWIEPSNKTSVNGSLGRPHVIFKRSAVDKVKAYHRTKRDIHSQSDAHISCSKSMLEQHLKRNEHTKRNIEDRKTLERHRKKYINGIEERRRRLEALRRNPTEYRRQQTRLRMEQRRLNNLSKSYSSQSSKSFENSVVRNKSRNKLNEPRLRRKNRRRRNRRSKNCATKQPPYQWKIKNLQRHEIEEHKSKTFKDYKRYQQRTQSRYSNMEESRRNTRSVSKPRHVEVLLVADKTMTDFHEKAKLQEYLLTIMNMIVVVKIILIEEEHTNSKLSVSSNADITLASFCNWQQQQNPYSDKDPHHHDVAILITRQDICSVHDAPCSTLGVAHVAGMCRPDRSCSVNEDNGIMLAHTITHELGHNFGLYHDTEKIGCHRREGSTLHIMTPIFEADTRQVAWSRCSKRDVTNFLDAGLGECLSDTPSQEEYEYPEVPAGVMFDAATQCHLQFGSEAVICAKPMELCEHLWCLVNDTCKTMLRPAAPGTTCGPNMWCQNQTCVPRTASPQPRNGGWGPWSEWSECSRTCGAGVSTQSRECNNPKPYNNGDYCIGARSRYKICNTDPCPNNEPTFREVQCAQYNNKTYKNMTYSEWIPYFDQDRPCELKCVPYDESELEIAGGFVIDGTPCRQNPGARDMCIAGVCYKVGCDWIVDSVKEVDACGVCGGNGSACKTVQGIYNKGTTRQSGHSEVAVIPAGSRNVKIQEKISPGNYLAIASANSKKVYINGARNNMMTEYLVAGSQAIYERDRDWEKVRIQGPIAEDIKVYQRLCRGLHRNPGVTYQYTVDRKRQKQFKYQLSKWSACSVTCDVGYMRRHLECVDQNDRIVDQSQCYHIEQPRHAALMQQCHQPSCPQPPTTSLATQSSNVFWHVSLWKPCPKACYMPGEEVIKQRPVHCVDRLTNTVIDDVYCDLATKPNSTVKCNVPAC